MAERPRKIGYFNQVSQFKAKFYVEGLRFAPVSMDRKIGEWLYYNYAAGSFHTKNLCNRLYSSEVEF